MYKVKDTDNIFLLLMRCVAIIEKDNQNNKISKVYYKAWCNICLFTVCTKEEISARKAVLAHIVSVHRDRWINHQGKLIEE
jgi:hypothetical protein